mmetsp:Transcript_2943/g.6371  ORF Transcript_2943/g.6371 Transcript_2943/m.6371 type:complete len:638 (+) Transcript_2943:112-2025(+)
MVDESLASDGQSSGLRRRRIGTEHHDGSNATTNNASLKNGKSNNGMMEESTAQQASAPSTTSLLQPTRQQPSSQQQSVVPLSMQLMRPFWQMSCCPDCRRPGVSIGNNDGDSHDDFFLGNADSRPRDSAMASLNNGIPAETTSQADSQQHGEAAGQINGTNNDQAHSNTVINNSSGRNFIPNMMSSNNNALSTSPQNNNVTIEQILHEYTTACNIYGCSTRLNPGILTTIRFSLPTLRVSGNFFDADMLALVEILIKHCNGALSYIKRLDFTIAGREGKNRGTGGGGGSGKKGIRSHGAYALSKVLTFSKNIEEVYLCGNRIGPYGASAIFTAAAANATLKTLLMRGCRIGERGALVFASTVCGENSVGGLKEVDLSACRIGFRGCIAIDEALMKRRTEDCGSGSEQLKEMAPSAVVVDLESNMVFQEVMNCVTHGLGILLGTFGTYLLNHQISGQPSHYTISCAIYSASLIVLYTSSTLYHSFFALRKTAYIFKVFDRCAIYLLIAGSYTPFLMIALHHEPLWSLHLLLFIWACAISGILVEAFALGWKHKSKFSLAMYLGMGWCCVMCLEDLQEVLPVNASVLMIAGGVAYTGGVPFFIRNNNLDHSIWHMFVLAGSILHWLAVYWYVAIPGNEG